MAMKITILTIGFTLFLSMLFAQESIERINAEDKIEDKVESKIEA